MTREIQLSQGRVALVDDEDYEWLNQWKWHMSSTGYARRNTTKLDTLLGTAKIAMHRVILNAPEGSMVDHIDCNKLNNQRSNLRLCTVAQNNRNILPYGKSGLKGVELDKRTGRWRAYVSVNKKRIHIGVFDTPCEAGLAYDAAARSYFGEFARPNFPNEVKP
jgi:hypothetical protein